MCYMYAFYKHEAYLELITTNLLVRISSIMLEWSRHIINMLLYENGEILTIVSIGCYSDLVSENPVRKPNPVMNLVRESNTKSDYFSDYKL